ncbi:MAG: hypothetical protein FD135_665, partial [Comamonadaceae bacterium]
QIQAHPADPSQPEPNVPPEQLLVGRGRVLDWFTNYLLRERHRENTTGWVINFQMVFDPPIQVSHAPGQMQLCRAISFHAERECREYERFVPLSGEAFVDWHTKSATIPANTQIDMQTVPGDFRDWAVRDPSKTRESSIFAVAFEAHEHQFEHVSDAPDLEAM